MLNYVDFKIPIPNSFLFELQSSRSLEFPTIMRLTPHEIDKLLLSQCGYRALQRLSRGVRLNIPESIALISMVVLELARDGFLSVAQLMSSGRQLLGRNQVIPGKCVLLFSNVLSIVLKMSRSRGCRRPSPG